MIPCSCIPSFAARIFTMVERRKLFWWNDFRGIPANVPPRTSWSPCRYPGFVLLYANQSTPTYVALRVLSSSLRGWFLVRMRLRATIVSSLPSPRLFSTARPSILDVWTYLWRSPSADNALRASLEGWKKNNTGFVAPNTRRVNGRS